MAQQLAADRILPLTPFDVDFVGALSDRQRCYTMTRSMMVWPCAFHDAVSYAMIVGRIVYNELFDLDVGLF